MATLDGVGALSHPRSWQGDVMADQYSSGVTPARLERPPNIAG
jgi:hypothetical protein